LWDGKLYVGSYDNNLYCFEDHIVQQMDASISLDKSQLAVGDTLTVTSKLVKLPPINIYEEIGRDTPAAGLPNAEVLFTFTDPTGEESEYSDTSDDLGWASVEFTPDTMGTWKVIAWYNGEDKSAYSYSYAFSTESTFTVTEGEVEPGQELVASVSPATSTIKVGETVTLTASATGGTPSYTYQWYQAVSGQGVSVSGETGSTLVVAPHSDGTYGYYCQITDSVGHVDSSDTAEIKVGAESAGIPMEYIYAIIVIIVVVIAIIVAYMLLKKRK